MKILPPISVTPSASARCRFLKLRSQGKTYDEIAVELGVSRRTLFYWNKELHEEVSFEEAAELESLRQTLLGTREARARRLAKRLAAIEEELDKRSLAELSTARLLSVADCLHRQIIKETTPQTPGKAKHIRQSFSEGAQSLDPAPASQCNDSAKTVQSSAAPPTAIPTSKMEPSLPSEDSGNVPTVPVRHLSTQSIDGATMQLPLDSSPSIQQSDNPTIQSSDGALEVQSFTPLPIQPSPALSQLPPRPPQLERMIGHKIDLSKVVGWKSGNDLTKATQGKAPL